MPERIPERFEPQRLYLRPYRTEDSSWFYPVSRRNRAHLARYEAQNIVMSVQNRRDTARVIQELASAWNSREAFFMGAFDRETDAFVAQVYVGPVNRELPEFEVGYFVEEDSVRGYASVHMRAPCSPTQSWIGNRRAAET